MRIMVIVLAVALAAGALTLLISGQTLLAATVVLVGIGVLFGHWLVASSEDIELETSKDKARRTGSARLGRHE
jgi:hypothetical protein